MFSVTNSLIHDTTSGKTPIFNEDGYIYVDVYTCVERTERDAIVFKDENGESIRTIVSPTYNAPTYTKMIGDVVMLFFVKYAGTGSVIFWVDLKTGENGKRSGSYQEPLFTGNTIHYIDCETNNITSWNLKEDTTSSIDIPSICRRGINQDDKLYYYSKIAYFNSELFFLRCKYGGGSISAEIYNLNGELVDIKLPEFNFTEVNEVRGENPSFCLDGSYFYIPVDQSNLMSASNGNELVDLEIKKLIYGMNFDDFEEMAIVNTFKNDDKTSIWIALFTKGNVNQTFVMLSSRMNRAKNARK